MEKEPVQRLDEILLIEDLSSKRLLPNVKNLDRILTKDLIRKAYRHYKDISTQKLLDDGLKELNSTGRQLRRQLGLHNNLQQDLQLESQLRLQHERHFEPHQRLHHGSQLRRQFERQLGCSFINEIIFAPLG